MPRSIEAVAKLIHRRGTCRCLLLRLELIFFDGAVEGLTAAFDAVLALPIARRQLRNDMVWPRRRLPRWIALAEVHHTPGDEAMTGWFVFVQSSHREGLSCVAQNNLGGCSLGAPASWS